MPALTLSSPVPPAMPTSTERRSSNNQDGSTSKADEVMVVRSANLLVERMAGVLRYKGYTEQAIEKMSSRAAANIVNAKHNPTESSLKDSDALSSFIDNTLLSKKALSEKNIHLNSNEPVLLMVVPEELESSPQDSRNLRDNLLLIFRSRGIRPVRVYVRRAGMVDSRDMEVMLLNVVNTDIGGPSMVQLLDAAFHGESWKEDLVSKEAWNGYDLIWRDESWSTTLSPDEPEVGHTIHTSEELPASSRTVTSAGNDKQSDTIGGLAGERDSLPPQHFRQVTSVPEEEEYRVPEPVEHPAMKELREREAARAHVEHPTWSRDHDNHHLLDIITTHSANVKTLEPISVISRSADDSSEEFEVVDEV